MILWEIILLKNGIKLYNSIQGRGNDEIRIKEYLTKICSAYEIYLYQQQTAF